MNSFSNHFRGYLEKSKRLVEQSTELNRNKICEGTGMLQGEKEKGRASRAHLQGQPCLRSPFSSVCFSGAMSDGCFHGGLGAPIWANKETGQNIACCQEWRKHEGIIQEIRFEFCQVFVESEFRCQAEKKKKLVVLSTETGISQVTTFIFL